MNNIYIDGQYLDATQTWHSEDSSWKAIQIKNIIDKNKLDFSSVAEIGCGSGSILSELSKCSDFLHSQFEGYDISPQAIKIAKQLEDPRIKFFQEDLLDKRNEKQFDALLVVDVFEHVTDYIGFIGNCKEKARYKIYHIPLDIHVSSVFRNAFVKNRYTIGHIHYFTADSALATLRDTGHEIVDFTYTEGAFGLFKEHPTIKKALANIPRYIFSKFSISFTARLLGGYSLLVLTK